MMVAKKGVYRHGNEELLSLDAETEEELVDEGPVSVVTEEMIGKRTKVIRERPWPSTLQKNLHSFINLWVAR